MRRFFLCIFAMFLLLIFGAIISRAAKPRTMTYGLPHQPHRRQTVKPYRLQNKRLWSPCTKHRKRRTRDGFDFPNVADTECFVQPR